MKTKIAPIKRPIEAKKYPKNTEAPYNNPPKTGPKIVPDCQATALKATASGKSFLSTIFGPVLGGLLYGASVFLGYFFVSIGLFSRLSTLRL